MYFYGRPTFVKMIFMRKYCSASVNGNYIRIPNRKDRSPCDILTALATTVRLDATAPHLKYRDDPYLTPTKNINKQTYYMALEAGRKAVLWIKDEHKNLFMNSEAIPYIQSFTALPVHNEDYQADTHNLFRLILNKEVEDAIIFYKELKEKGVTVSRKVKQILLELLSFNNCQNSLYGYNQKNHWFHRNDKENDSSQHYDFAEDLFREIIKEDPSDPRPYSALLRGMCKNSQGKRVYELLQQAIDKNINIDTNAYSAVFSAIPFLKITAEDRWSLCCDVLEKMSNRRIKPNLNTLNAILQCISTFGNYKFASDCALKTLSEFKALDIEPSLSSYYFILNIFCKETGPTSHILFDILNHTVGKSFTVKHPKDTYFFVTAMNVCRNYLHDRVTAKNLHNLLHTGNNYNFIGDTHRESIYFRHYFALLCQTESIHEFMQTYDLLVPNVYIPEPGIMEELLKAIAISSAVEYIPKIWLDIVQFNYLNRESIVLLLLNIMTEKRSQDIQSQEKLDQHFAKIALDVFSRCIKLQDSGKGMSAAFTGEMLGNIWTLLIRSKNFDNAHTVFEYMDKNQHQISKTPTEESFLEFMEYCVEKKMLVTAMQCLQYVIDNNMEPARFARRILDGFTLNSTDLTKIKSFINNKPN